MCLNSTLIYGFKLWVETESVRLWIKAGVMCFLRTVFGLSLRERVRNPKVWSRVTAPPSPFGAQLGGDHGVEPELTAAAAARSRIIRRQ